MKTLEELDQERIARDIIPYKGRVLDQSKPIKVYRNLGHSSPCKWSVMQGRLVIGHSDALCIRDVKPHVNVKTQKKIRQTKRKAVHAWLEGFIVGGGMGVDALSTACAGTPISYNPYKNDTFIYIVTNNKYTGSLFVRFQGTKVESAY